MKFNLQTSIVLWHLVIHNGWEAQKKNQHCNSIKATFNHFFSPSNCWWNFVIFNSFENYEYPFKNQCTTHKKKMMVIFLPYFFDDEKCTMKNAYYQHCMHNNFLPEHEQKYSKHMIHNGQSAISCPTNFSLFIYNKIVYNLAVSFRRKKNPLWSGTRRMQEKKSYF